MEKQFSNEHSTSSNIFLTGVMLFANMDFSGFMDYAVKVLEKEKAVQHGRLNQGGEIKIFDMPMAA